MGLATALFFAFGCPSLCFGSCSLVLISGGGAEHNLPLEGVAMTIAAFLVFGCALAFLIWTVRKRQQP